MRNNLYKISTVALALAITFTLSCSSDDGNNPSDGDGSPVTGGADGGGNQDPQVYNINGTPFTGSGVIEVYRGMGCSSSNDDGTGGGCEWDNAFIAGNVNEGIVNLNLPNIPSEYFKDFLKTNEQNSCSKYPKDIKYFKGSFVLTNSSKDYLGNLKIGYGDEQLIEKIYYWYFSKDGQITCNFEEINKDGVVYKTIINTNVKEGWNKIYYRETSTKEELSTNSNILTKEVKWTWGMF